MKPVLRNNLILAILGAVLFLCLSLLSPLVFPDQNSQAATRYQILAEADKLYLLGKRPEAERLYRQVKPAFSKESLNNFPQPITDPEKLSPAGRVYWRIAQEGIKENLETKIFAPLELLLKEQPEFVPAYVLMTQALQERNKNNEALEILEKGASMFPDSVELVKAQVNALQIDKQWLEASIAARQFAIVNPKHPETPEFTRLADENFGRFHDELNTQIIILGILNAVINPNKGLLLAPLMLQGESAFGSELANLEKQHQRLIQDKVVLDYVNGIGQDMAKLMGRDFQYEFYVVQDSSINAFALPGGKVFVNTGAIMATRSEAELAGLLGHEVSHAVLSHGFQKIVSANLLADLKNVIPFGNLIASLVFLEFSRQNERQSDILGTRAIAASGYAADGVYNLMDTLSKQQQESLPPYLSSHPVPTERVSYLQGLIQQNGYNRYAFEGVEKHAAIQKRLKQLIGG